jgi:hypothetical protein
MADLSELIAKMNGLLDQFRAAGIIADLSDVPVGTVLTDECDECGDFKYIVVEKDGVKTTELYDG